MKGDMELYSRLSQDVTAVIKEKAPVMEKASIDEFYLDISGMDKFYGGYKWTNELSQEVTRETGLPISFALSVNKTVSKIGTGESKPKGNLEIPENKVRPFLNPLSIKKIPGVGSVTFQLLSRLGIRNIQTLSEMPAEVLSCRHDTGPDPVRVRAAPPPVPGDKPSARRAVSHIASPDRPRLVLPRG